MTYNHVGLESRFLALAIIVTLLRLGDDRVYG